MTAEVGGHVEPATMPELVDPTGMKWRWVPAGYLREDEATTLTPEQVAEDFLAVAVTS